MATLKGMTKKGRWSEIPRQGFGYQVCHSKQWVKVVCVEISEWMGWRYGEGGYNWSIWSYMKMKKIHFCVERRLCVSNKTIIIIIIIKE